MFKFKLKEVEDLVVSGGATEAAMGWQSLWLETAVTLTWVLFMDYYFNFVSISV